MKDIFVHHVLFWLKNPSDEAARIRFEEALKKLVAIQTIYQYQLGKPADTRREVIDSSYQYSLLTLFKNSDDHDYYQIDPVHDRFREVVNELCTRVQVFDSVSY